MILAFLLVIAGFASLLVGANWMVDGASALAKKYRVPDLAIGLTIVAFGTSAPELVVNIIASVNGYSDIVLGNIIGSNNFNLFIILGLSGLMLPIQVQSSTAWREIPVSLFISVLLFLFLNDFMVSGPSWSGRVDGIILLLLFFGFLYYVFRQMKNHPADETAGTPLPALKIWVLILAGLGGMVIGGQLVVANSVSIAERLGVSEKIIGLTIVAAGTSLPELVTSVVAAARKNADIAIGNVIGSNIFNILLILAISSIIRPIAYNPAFNLDMAILTGGTALLLVFMLTGKRKRLDRWEAGVLFGSYALFMVYLVWAEMT
ncbi:calcium/sodium antiporter [Roseivirga sp. BDSF3-8]|uniref:calcium/sodium antiporter n=1 Tax=Roseivirga sp. BDSF3-8 TaxID=3241598 RepID=UPI003531BCFE